MTQRAFMTLSCKLCGERWPDDTKMEAVKLHMEVEHDTADIALELIVVCRCGATMGLFRQGPRFDEFQCPHCKLFTRVKRTPTNEAGSA